MARAPGGSRFDQCADEIAAAGANLSRADVLTILHKTFDRATGGKSAMQAARELGDEATAAAAIAKRNQLINLRNRIELRGNVEARLDTLGERYGKQKYYLSIRNEVTALNTPVDRGRFSAESAANTQALRWSGGAMRELENAGLADPLRTSEPFSDDVGREVYELSMKAAGEDARPGRTGNKPAIQAAEILHKWQSLARDNLNRAGAWIGDYAGYITRTTHDGMKMWKAGYDQWRGDILAELDLDRTFEGVENREGFLHHVYDALITGIHHTDGETVGFKEPAFTGPGNLAEKLSAEKVLHFNDADSWLRYQKKYGSGSLGEQFMTAFARAGKQEQLMRRFGTNPRAEYENLINWAEQKYVNEDPEAAKYLRDNREALMTRFSYLDGTNNRPANELVASISQGIHNVQSMAHLGFVAFTHIFSMAGKASELRYKGVGFLESWANVFGSLRQGQRGAGEMRQLYDLVLAGLDGQHGHYMQRFTLDDSVPGMMSSATSNFMKWSGLNFVLGSEKAGHMAMLARHLGMQVDQDYAHLDPETQRAFLQYGISAQDWDRMRSAEGHFTTEDGRTYLTPDAANRAAPELNDKGADMFGAPERDDLALRLQALISDSANSAVVTPGIEQRAAMFGNNRPGTPWGEALRFFWQFKAWPMAAAQQLMGREIHGSMDPRDWKSAAIGISSLVLASTVLGYGRMVVTDLMKGLNPRAPNDPSTWMAALAQGGGLGIMGDFMFGGLSRNQQNIYDTFAGPAFGTVAQLFTVFNQLKEAAVREGDPKPIRQLPSELLRIAADNAPFVNLFYLRTALNYLLIWRVQEALNPGYQRRYERRVQHDRNQTFWLSPAQAVRQ